MEFAQHNRMHTDHLIDNLFVFIGGFLLSLTHPFHFTLSILVEPSLVNAGFFVLRAFLGGALALLGKIGVEWCIKKYRSTATKKNQQ